MDINSILEVLNIAEQLKCNTRHSWTSSGRQESVAEHSWRLSLFAFLLKDNFQDVNIDKVIKMCLIHDLGEALTGDIPSFDKTQRDESTEDEAIEYICNKLSGSIKYNFIDLFREIKEGRTSESKLFKALDKLEAVIQHNEADISSWLPIERALNLVYGEEECSNFKFLTDLRAECKHISKEKVRLNRKEKENET